MPDEIPPRRPPVWPSLLVAIFPTAAAWGFALSKHGAEYLLFAFFSLPVTVIGGVVAGAAFYGLQVVRYNARMAEAIASRPDATATGVSE